MKCSLGISSLLEEISSLSHSIIFLYFFALFPQKGFLISPCYSLEFCIQVGISFLFSSAFFFFFFFFFGLVTYLDLSFKISCTFQSHHLGILRPWCCEGQSSLVKIKRLQIKLKSLCPFTCQVRDWGSVGTSSPRGTIRWQQIISSEAGRRATQILHA